MKSEKRTDISGKEYIQHYDEDGKRTIKSYAETNRITGREEVVHYDERGKKVGVSQKKKDYWTDKDYIETERYDPYESEKFTHSLIDKLSPVFFVVIAVIFVVSYIHFM